MRQKAKDVGLNVVYQVNEKAPTGKCAVLITGNDRSLVAHLGAANNFTPDHLDVDHHWNHVTKAKVLYVSGFFFTVSPESIMRFAKFAHEHDRTFTVNLSAPFLSQFFKDKLVNALPYVDILFGNDDVNSYYVVLHFFTLTKFIYFIKEASTFSKSVLENEVILCQTIMLLDGLGLILF